VYFPGFSRPTYRVVAYRCIAGAGAIPFKDSDAHAIMPHSASTMHLRGDPQNGHGDMQLEGYIPGLPEPAHPGSTVVPPFPSATNVRDSRGTNGKDGGLGRPERQTGEAGRRELVSQTLIFALAFVGANLLLCWT
jgi:hypothetical protein